MTYLNGSCLCGNVRIRVPDDFAFAGYCHCSQCHAGNVIGSFIRLAMRMFAAGGLVDSSDFQITQGEAFISYYATSEDTDRGFCSNCGSSLFSRKLKRGKHIVRLGILDDAPTQRPNVHIFVTHKAPWFEIADGLEQLTEGPA